MRRPLFAMLFLLTQIPAQEGKAELWVTDFAKAKAQAKADKKDLLIAFTGSDWCQPCIRLDEEVFAQGAFTTAAPKSFVLVKLDAPRDESKITPETKAQNEKLAEQYSIRGVPTVLLTDADGLVYAQTGYQPDGAEKYLTMLGELQKKGASFQKALGAAADKKAVERATAVHEALALLDEEVVNTHHLALMEEIVKLDADGKAGLKEKYEPKIKEIAEGKEVAREAKVLNDLVAPLMEEGKGKEALAKVDELIKAPKSTVQHQLALFYKGMITMDVDGDVKAAIAALEASKALAPQSPVSKRIEQILPQLKQQPGGEDKKDEKKEEKKQAGG
jgi:thioredoxin-related protein